MPREKCLLSCDTAAAAAVGELSEEECGGGWSVGRGRPTAVSHQRSVNCSQPVATSQGLSNRVQLRGAWGGGGPKIPSIRRSSQFVCPYPRRSSASQALLSGVMRKSVAQKHAVLTAIWERLCLFLVVFHLFTLFSALALSSLGLFRF